MREVGDRRRGVGCRKERKAMGGRDRRWFLLYKEKHIKLAEVVFLL